MKLDRCVALLAECQTAEQAKRVADLSEAVRVYAKRAGAGKEVVNRAAEYKLRAERRLGEIQSKTEKAKRPQGPGRGKVGPLRYRLFLKFLHWPSWGFRRS